MKLHRLLHAATLFCVSFAAAQSVQPLLQPRQFFPDGSGAPCAGCKFYSYAAGTTTPLATYTDASGLVQNTNPVILDVAGTAPIWPTRNASYKFVLKDALGNLIWTVDNVTNPSGFAPSGTNGQIQFNCGSVVCGSAAVVDLAGNLTTLSTNGVINEALQTGSDTGARIASAISALTANFGVGGTVQVTEPGGNLTGASGLTVGTYKVPVGAPSWYPPFGPPITLDYTTPSATNWGGQILVQNDATHIEGMGNSVAGTGTIWSWIQGFYVISQTAASGGTATYTWALDTSEPNAGRAPQIGDLITITGTTNGSGIFNVVNAPITAVTSTTFTVSLAGTYTAQAEAGAGTNSGTYRGTGVQVGNYAICTATPGLCSPTHGHNPQDFKLSHILLEGSPAQVGVPVLDLNSTFYPTVESVSVYCGGFGTNALGTIGTQFDDGFTNGWARFNSYVSVGCDKALVLNQIATAVNTISFDVADIVPNYIGMEVDAAANIKIENFNPAVKLFNAQITAASRTSSTVSLTTTARVPEIYSVNTGHYISTTGIGNILASTTATITDSSSTITIASATGTVNGLLVYGSGIPSGTVIVSGGGTTTLVLSNPSTVPGGGTATNVTVRFGQTARMNSISSILLAARSATAQYDVTSVNAAVNGVQTATGMFSGCAANACQGTMFTVSGSNYPVNNGTFFVLTSNATTLTWLNSPGVADTFVGQANSTAGTCAIQTQYGLAASAGSQVSVNGLTGYATNLTDSSPNGPAWIDTITNGGTILTFQCPGTPERFTVTGAKVATPPFLITAVPDNTHVEFQQTGSPDEAGAVTASSYSGTVGINLFFVNCARCSVVNGLYEVAGNVSAEPAGAMSVAVWARPSTSGLHLDNIGSIAADWPVLDQTSTRDTVSTASVSSWSVNDFHTNTLNFGYGYRGWIDAFKNGVTNYMRFVCSSDTNNAQFGQCQLFDSTLTEQLGIGTGGVHAPNGIFVGPSVNGHRGNVQANGHSTNFQAAGDYAEQGRCVDQPGTTQCGWGTAGFVVDNSLTSPGWSAAYSVFNASAPNGFAVDAAGQTVPASTTNQAVLTCIDVTGTKTTAARSISNNIVTTGGASEIIWTYTQPTGCTSPYLWFTNNGTFSYYTAVTGSAYTQLLPATSYTAAASYPVGAAFPGNNNTSATINVTAPVPLPAGSTVATPSTTDVSTDVANMAVTCRELPSAPISLTGATTDSVLASVTLPVLGANSHVYVWADTVGGAGNGSMTGFTSYLGVQTTATTTNGSNQLTNAASITGISNGQLIVMAGVPVGTTVSGAPSGTTITMSANATASATVTGTFNTAINNFGTFANASKSIRLEWLIKAAGSSSSLYHFPKVGLSSGGATITKGMTTSSVNWGLANTPQIVSLHGTPAAGGDTETGILTVEVCP